MTPSTQEVEEALKWADKTDGSQVYHAERMSKVLARELHRQSQELSQRAVRLKLALIRPASQPAPEKP